MLGDLEHQAVAVVAGLERVQDRRQIAVELHVDDGADDLRDAAGAGVGGLVFGGLLYGFGHGLKPRCAFSLSTRPAGWSAAPADLRRLERFRAGDDLDQFLGDHRLARAVVELRLLLDHVAGVARGVVHRAHARALLGGGVLEDARGTSGR